MSEQWPEAGELVGALCQAWALAGSDEPAAVAVFDQLRVEWGTPAMRRALRTLATELGGG